jgi:hypothetical protein
MSATLAANTQSATATGRFLVITLGVTNDADSPEMFGPPGIQQTEIVGHGRSYSEDFAAENGPDPRSCVSMQGSIQPQGTATCDVVYDMPTPAIARARTHGLGLLVANFGDNLVPGSTTPTPALDVLIISASSLAQSSP